jgi:hypothetical protein
MNRFLRMAALLLMSVAVFAISLGCGPGNKSFK